MRGSKGKAKIWATLILVGMDTEGNLELCLYLAGTWGCVVGGADVVGMQKAGTGEMTPFWGRVQLGKGKLVLGEKDRRRPFA